MRCTERTTARSRRGGLLLVSVLVSLTVAMMLFAVWVRSAMVERGWLRLQQSRLQSEYLAAAGVSRAQAQLAADPAYQGETWRPNTESWDGRGNASVEISVSPVEDDPLARRVRVAAQFSTSATDQARRSQEIKIALQPEGTTP